ncbi:uncharacterized protein LY89DRAFT_587057 [Mollisia scopiformis]|uniref:C2H2-type domain-containing protein n=1 Tax=Mollisia scopiformis TaxID=149040 RepID=A0A194X6V7_MOLSC|nr:uncharacterized protein LY89DRAFT_587057 [Mollisia scopiformis]KUJ15910.1 hypothetical protein LY89DRAFT_587057 [Mollisia scopiformis]
MSRFFNESRKESQLPLFNAAPINGGQVFAHGYSQTGAPIQSLPQAAFMRHASPSLSQGLSSNATSAQSPVTDPDWSYYSPGQEEYAMHGGMEFYANSPPTYANSPPPFESAPPLAPSHYQHYSLPTAQAPGNSCVNMSQVQGFADPQEVTFDADEGYEEMNLKSEYNMEAEKQQVKTEYRHQEAQDYHYHTDSAVGSSIKDINSPEDTSIQAGDDATSDIDAEGEIDNDQDAIEVDPASDTEYTPRSTRTRKRPSTTSTTKPTPKKNSSRVSKPKSSTTNSKITCKSCDAPPFKDVTQLARHMASTHTRAFICVFSFAGCASTFASKNEWKRHVSSQHLNLTAWICEIGSCAKVNASKPGGAEFNRKDLFTQHLRRMHAPHSVKRKKQVDENWEKELKELQVSCLKVKRQAPGQLRCPVRECSVTFEGPNCWDERMEHVGKHLERAAAAGETGVDQGRDVLLINWAVKERIVEERVGGGYRLVVGSKRDEEEDADAEGEIE